MEGSGWPRPLKRPAGWGAAQSRRPVSDLEAEIRHLLKELAIAKLAIEIDMASLALQVSQSARNPGFPYSWKNAGQRNRRER